MTNDNPLFSVLIANYNNGRFLQEAIDSVLAQTYTNWEVVIVDDKSADNSFEIYEKYKDDSRFHIYYNEKNEGCGYTKRRCAELATGEICGFLDPDDVLLVDALEKHVCKQQERTDCSAVVSRYYFCDSSLNVIKESRLLKLSAEETYFTHKDYAPETFCSFKKAMYDKTEGIASDIKLGVDQDLYFKLEEIAPMCVLDAFTYKYRLHDKNISQKPSNEAVYWNLIVRHRTCMRRGLDPSDYPVADFVAYSRNTYNEGADKVRQSQAYRLGKFFIKPFSWIKKH